MAPIRVLVVEDSLTVRRLIVDVLDADPDLEVVGECEDGKTAIELCQRLRPDVISLDMMLPVMTGLATTEYVMAHFPTPILIVSSSTNRGELFRTYEALAAGAVDVFEKPRGDEAGDEWSRRLIAALKMVSRIKVITHLRGRLPATERPQHLRPRDADAKAAVVAIGASTGGPGAIATILRDLPADFVHPILLVIHLGDPFGAAFADWLDGLSPIRVAFAEDGQLLPPPGKPRVIMAPPNFHLSLRNGRLRLTMEEERHSCRPSVDVLFDSLATLGDRAVGCLLTGMGRDGAAGLLSMRLVGARTIAQDEATSVVYGMPREAALLGAAERVLPLGQIGRVLGDIARSGSHR